MTVGKRLSLLRKEKEYSLEYVGSLIDVSKQTLYKYEKDIINNIPLKKIEKLANIYDVTPTYILGWNNSKISHEKDIINKYTKKYTDYKISKKDLFTFKIKNKSMMPRIHCNDTLVINKQSDVKNGDIALVVIKENEPICRKIIKQKSNLILMPFNTNFDPEIYTWEEVQNIPIIIIGKVIEIRSKL